MRKLIFTFCILAALPMLFSCNSSKTSPLFVLQSMCDKEANLPDGIVYTASSKEGEDSFLSSEMKSVLYSESDMSTVFPLIKDFAIRISTFEHPCEFAVFLCYSRSNANDVAKMCFKRLDMLNQYYKQTEYDEYTKNASVNIVGKYVIMTVSPDSEKILVAAKKALGS